MPAEPTVRKYLAKEDLSAVPSVRKPRASVIDPYLPVIEQWLAEDRANWCVLSNFCGPFRRFF